MSRIDLLALTADDLAAITNRGTVKRAQKELDEGSPSFTFHEATNELICEWSDGIVCRFPAGKMIHDAICSSGVVGISRHIVRSVLAYQKYRSAPPVTLEPVPAASSTGDNGPSEGDASLESLPAPSQAVTLDWNPGDISDAQLVDHFRAATVTKARQRFERGVLVELVRGPKPLARFLDDPCTIRFLVPGDVRYTTADCADPLLGTFVPMAVWAFRQLESEKRSGLVALQQTEAAVPTDVLDDVDALLFELCLDGLQGLSSTWPQRLIRQEARCRETDLVWLAELLVDLMQQLEMYVSRDAAFDPPSVTRLVGELLVRSKAIRSGTTAVPQLLIRGNRSDRTTELASSRLVGLGCGVRQSTKAVTITAFMQDVDAGGVMCLDRTFANPDADSTNEPKDFATLAQTVISRGISLSSIGAGQLLIKAGKRTPGGRLILPRTSSSISLNPQAYTWEHLRAPLAVEGFAELSARLELLPPSSLRPRRLTEALHVCPAERFEGVAFDVRSQRLVGTAVDSSGEQARLSHPFTTRGAAGFENLMAVLTDESLRPRFICGHVSRRSAGVMIEPICVVFENAEGKRRAVSPWTDARPTASTSQHDAETTEASAPPLARMLNDIAFELSELLLVGMRRAGPMEANRWKQLAAHVARCGFVRLSECATALAAQLSQRSEQVDWDERTAVSMAMKLLLLNRMADDIPLD